MDNDLLNCYFFDTDSQILKLIKASPFYFYKFNQVLTAKKYKRKSLNQIF